MDIVYNLIRGCNPSPGAATVCGGRQLKIFDCEKRALSGLEARPSPRSEGFWLRDAAVAFVKRVQPEAVARWLLRTCGFGWSSGGNLLGS